MPVDTPPNAHVFALIGIVASAIPFWALYAWAYTFARRHREQRPGAYGLAVRGLGVLAAGELVNIWANYARWQSPISGDVQSLTAFTNMGYAALSLVFHLLGIYLLVRACFRER
jgi:hypothetical protein